MIHVAIDGPAGSGKSTVAKMLSEKTGILYVDSGALYRMIGYYFLINKIVISDNSIIDTHLNEINIEYKNSNYYLNNTLITTEIRNEECGKYASLVGKNVTTRNKINEILKRISKYNSTIIDGRDIGTVVLPCAEIKIFLEASVEERANRRLKELKKRKINSSYKKIYSEISQRDFNDINRKIAPLKPAKDSIIIDTTLLSINEVVEKIFFIYKKRIEKIEF